MGDSHHRAVAAEGHSSAKPLRTASAASGRKRASKSSKKQEKETKKKG
jgi:hypothetical protein